MKQGTKAIKEIYRGHQIDVHWEIAMGGWANLLYSVTRLSDGKVWIDSFITGEDTVEEYVGYMKGRIDNMEDGIDDSE